MALLGSNQKETVRQRQCRKDRKQGKEVCKFTEETVEDGKVVAEGVVEVDLDENGQPLDTHENTKGYDTDEIEELKDETREEAIKNADGGALNGNTEM